MNICDKGNFDKNNLELWQFAWTRNDIKNFWNNVSQSPLAKLSFSRLCSDFLVKSVSPYIKKDWNILDFGAGDGDFCLAMLNAGYKMAAYEPSEGRNEHFLTQVEQNKNFLGHVNSGTFDCVTCFEVLEHIYPDDIQQTMEKLSSFIKPGGLFFGTVPCNENLEDNYCICPHCAAMFHRWQHMRSFNIERLRDFLIQYEYNVLKIEYASFTNSLIFVCNKN